jgi:hypothetical protein
MSTIWSKRVDKYEMTKIDDTFSSQKFKYS